MQPYIVGDVHGMYDTLMKAIRKAPEGSYFYFVGDLIDRGPDSKKVVEFVRNGKHGCVLGNHEEMMIHGGERMKEMGDDYRIESHWAQNGGLQTLMSYGVLELDDGGHYIYTRDKESIEVFLDDVEWMKDLPLYEEVYLDRRFLPVYFPFARSMGIDPIDVDLDKEEASVKEHRGCLEKPIIVSHSCVKNIWHNLEGITKRDPDYEMIKEYTLWNREEVEEDYDSPIYNVFGHTINKGTERGVCWANIDTGCVYEHEGYGRLTMFNVKTGDLIFTRRVETKEQNA